MEVTSYLIIKCSTFYLSIRFLIMDCTLLTIGKGKPSLEVAILNSSLNCTKSWLGFKIKIFSLLFFFFGSSKFTFQSIYPFTQSKGLSYLLLSRLIKKATSSYPPSPSPAVKHFHRFFYWKLLCLCKFLPLLSSCRFLTKPWSLSICLMFVRWVTCAKIWL